MNNGNVKWLHFVTITLTMVTIGITVTICVTSSLVSALDKVETRSAVAREKNEGRITKNEQLFNVIDKRLARIENKLGVQ